VRLIKPKVEIINQEPGVEGLFKHMELCARTCYKSEDKITEDSARKFIDNVIVARGHTAMLEHGTVYLIIDCSGRLLDVANKYVNNKYSEWTLHPDGVHYCITTNYRVLLQNGWLDDLQYLCEPTEYHVRRITVRFICDMGVAREFCRHRVFSFAQESTRYCNYAKDKFGNELTFIQPCWITDESLSHWRTVMNSETEWFRPNNAFPGINMSLHSLEEAEDIYLALINEEGWKPQQARNVLPLALKTELIMTGTDEQWAGFFNLRCARDAHPQARELAIELRDRMILAGYINTYDPGSIQV
jgi:thymidylate synthase (FAD)